MKFRVTMKDPDTLLDSVNEAVMDDLKKVEGLNRVEIEAVADQRKEEFSDLCGAWFRYGEYLTVEIDTDAKTCVVVPNKD